MYLWTEKGVDSLGVIYLVVGKKNAFYVHNEFKWIFMFVEILELYTTVLSFSLKSCWVEDRN